MKMRCRARSIVALILLLSAAYSFYSTCLLKRPPLRLTILSERVILKEGLWAREAHFILSPDGRHFLFLREETLHNEAGPSTPVTQPCLLDVGTGEILRLPFPPVPYDDVDHWVGDAFTSDGNYIHVVEPEGTYQEPDRPWVLLYDIRNRTLRRIKIGPCCWVTSDDLAENLLVTTHDLMSPSKYRLAVVPIANLPAVNVESLPIGTIGAVEWFNVNGIVRGLFRKDRAMIFSNAPRRGWSNLAPELSVVDLTRGKTLKSFRLDTGFDGADYPAPFWTADGRFLCYFNSDSEPNLLDKVRSAIAHMAPFIGRSIPGSDWICYAQACFWDSTNDRVATMRDTVALWPGPTPSSVVIVDAGWQNLRLLDLATGKECHQRTEANYALKGAYSKYYVYWDEDADEAGNFVLVEIGLAGQGR